MPAPYTDARFFISLKGSTLTVHALIENSAIFDRFEQSLEDSIYLPMYIDFPDLNFDEAILFMSYEEISSECSVKLVKVDQKFYLKPETKDFKQALSPFIKIKRDAQSSLNEQDIDWRINIPAEISAAQQITALSVDNDSEPFRQPQIGPRPFSGVRRTGSHKSVEVVGQEGREYRRTRTRPQLDAVGFSDPVSEVPTEPHTPLHDDRGNAPVSLPPSKSTVPPEPPPPLPSQQAVSRNTDKQVNPDWLTELDDKHCILLPAESQRSLDLPHPLAQDAALTFLKKAEMYPPPLKTGEGTGKEALIAASKAFSDDTAGLLLIKEESSSKSWFVYLIKGSPVSAFRKPAEKGANMTTVMTRAGLLGRYDADLVLSTTAKQNSNELEIMAQLKVVSQEILMESLASYINLILRDLLELDNASFSLYPMSPEDIPQVTPWETGK